MRVNFVNKIVASLVLHKKLTNSIEFLKLMPLLALWLSKDKNIVLRNWLVLVRTL